MNNEELKHYGIKGQKWGRRRYQNKDGSLTPAGEKRYGSKENFEENYDADVKNSMTSTKKAIDEANKTIKPYNDGANNRQSNREKRAKKEVEKVAREEAKKMTDQELRDVVNRLNMEERYTQVMRDRATIDVGRSSVEKFMDRTATALTVASTAMSIAIMMQELKK